MAVSDVRAGQLRPTLRLSRVEPIETACLVVALVIIIGTFKGLLASDTGDADRSAGSAFSQALNLAIFGSGLLMLLFRGMSDLMARVFLRSWPLLLLIGLTLLSAAWSVAPGVSFRRSVALILSTSFAYVIISRYSMEEFLRILFAVLVVYLIVGVLAAAVPGQGIGRTGMWAGAWRGFTGMKNEFGRILAFAIAAFCIYRIVGLPWWRQWWMPATLLALVLLLLSQSKTALVATAAAVAGPLFLRIVFQPRIGRWYIASSVRILFATTVVGSALLFLLVALPPIVEALGRDLTLSGRTKLWEWAADIGIKRPWLGAGFRTFWIDENTKYFFESFYWGASPDGEPSDSYAGPANGHNGYIDVWLELGYVGLAAFLVFLFAMLKRVQQCFATRFWIPAYSLAMILSYLLVYSITERVTLQHTEGIWFLVTLFYLYADPELARSRSEGLSLPQDGFMRHRASGARY